MVAKVTDWQTRGTARVKQISASPSAKLQLTVEGEYMFLHLVCKDTHKNVLIGAVPVEGENDALLAAAEMLYDTFGPISDSLVEQAE
jgi:hypothetical protein